MWAQEVGRKEDLAQLPPSLITPNKRYNIQHAMKVDITSIIITSTL